MKLRTVTYTLMAVLLALTGCSRPDTANTTGAADAGVPVTGDWIVARLDADADTLNPHTTSTTNSSTVYYGANNSNIYESLVGSEPSDWVTPKAVLAEARPEVSPDHLIYTFTLRQGITWHDGKPLTPEDVVFSFKSVMCPSVDSAPTRSNLTDLVNVEADGWKIRMTVSKAHYLNEGILGGYTAVIPKHVFDPQGILDSFTFKDVIAAKNVSNPKLLQFGKEFNQNPAGRAPIGTGPYKFEKWESGKEIVVVRNEQYWGQKPYLDKIIYRIITDATAALTALKSGDIDMNPRLTPIQFAQQTSGAAFDQQLAKSKYTIPAYYYIGWNQERPFFRDKRVRQALTMLLDRQQVVDTLRFGLGKLAVAPFNPNSPYFNPNLKPVPYDPKRALELLDEAGWKDTNGDGIRDKDGRAFKFELISSTSDLSNKLSPVVKEELRKVGIEVSERHLEFTVLSNSIRDKQFDANLGGWASDLVSDPFQVWHSSSIPNRGSNYISFRNKQSDELLEQGRLEFDPEKRKQIYWRWMELIADEQPYTFLFYAEEAAAYSKRFQNAKFLPTRPGYDLNTWYVPKMTQKYTNNGTRTP